jgi:uncharacterized protein YdiU (UPF0061 family)
MANLQRRIDSLSEQLAQLETRLGEAAGELAELNYTMAGFLERYRNEIMGPLEELVLVEREVADMRILLGDRQAMEAGEITSPLERLRKANRSVEEQYRKTWYEPDAPRPDQTGSLAPANEKVKDLYGQLVSRLHPYLVADPEEQVRRADLMRQVNEAYVKRNHISLQAMHDATKERSNLPVIASEQVAEDLHDRVLDLELLVAQIEGQRFELRHGEVGMVWAEAQQAKAEGRDLLQELNRDIRTAINNGRRTLEELRKQHNPSE